MRRRTFEEIVSYFNQTVSEMDIERKYKMTLLGMVLALLQRRDEDVAQIEPERKKGKWINIRHDNIAECDQCGTTGRAWMNFCPICGADMREEDA